MSLKTQEVVTDRGQPPSNLAGLTTVSEGPNSKYDQIMALNRAEFFHQVKELMGKDSETVLKLGDQTYLALPTEEGGVTLTTPTGEEFKLNPDGTVETDNSKDRQLLDTKIRQSLMGKNELQRTEEFVTTPNNEQSTARDGHSPSNRQPGASALAMRVEQQPGNEQLPDETPTRATDNGQLSRLADIMTDKNLQPPGGHSPSNRQPGGSASEMKVEQQPGNEQSADKTPARAIQEGQLSRLADIMTDKNLQPPGGHSPGNRPPGGSPSQSQVELQPYPQQGGNDIPTRPTRVD